MENIDVEKNHALTYVYSILKELNCGDIETFDERLKTQKVQYFAQLFGVSPFYKYSLYLHGPYSPSLAKDLYMIKDKEIKAIKGDIFILDEVRDRFKKLSEFVRGKTSRELELMATMHWLLKAIGLSEKDAKEKIRQLKSPSDEEIACSFDRIIQYERIQKSFNNRG